MKIRIRHSMKIKIHKLSMGGGGTRSSNSDYASL